MLIYGTAWKENQTQALTSLAIRTGFRAIDTANQRRHYFEAGVGEALQECYAANLVKREDLFLQTKFTFAGGQDHRLPYDPKAPYQQQVRQSFTSSREHLHTDYLDSYVLHGPSGGRGLTLADHEVWAAMQRLFEEKKVKSLGISNVDLDQLDALCQAAKIKPRYVQNRCYARFGWDKEVREFCGKHQITYQGFSLLTANSEVLRKPRFVELVKKHGKTPAQIVFRFAIDIGMLPLTGTSSEQHMREDLAIQDFQLTPEELETLEAIA